MSRMLARAVRLVKIGAVAGAVVGVGRLIMQRRRRSEVDESSWPTIAETAAQNGQPVDGAEPAEADDDAADDDAADGDAADGDAADGDAADGDAADDTEEES